ncbi:citrate/2-methylcitrate synthase, partial [Nocardia abscessus]|uniref:citrate/2-methylcitrate synthase n=1 Tax=Nocardia abscessus TaxID=120957 RepID=UPI0024568E0B
MTEIKKGLAGVVVDTTAISKVVPETNSLTYRGYAVPDLARHCGFEEVAYLLWYGELPDAAQLELLCQRERAQRRIDRSVLSLIEKMPDSCHPMDVVRTVVSYLGAEDPEEDPSGATAQRALPAKALRLTAVLPTVIAAPMRRRGGGGTLARANDPGGGGGEEEMWIRAGG